MLSSALLARANSGLTFRPTEDTVLWLPGQDRLYTPTIKDHSDSGNDGTITGATRAQTGQGLWYLDFDGNDDIVDLGNPTSLRPANISVLTWARSPDLKDQGLVTAWGSGANLAFEIHPNVTGTVTFAVRTAGGSNNAVTGDIGYEDNVWRLYSMAWDGTNNLSYINGAFQATNGDAAGDMKAITNNVFIGKEERNARFFKGGVALVRIFNRALTAAETLNIFNQEKHLFGVE